MATKKTAPLAADPAAEEQKPGEDVGKDDVDAAAEIGPTEQAAPVVEDGGQTKSGPTVEEAAKGEDGSKNSKAAKAAADKAEAKAQAEKGEQPTFKEVFVFSLNTYNMSQQPSHVDAKERYILKPGTDPQRAFDDQWLRNNISAGLLKLQQ